jgi:hypothetical protein
LALFSPFADATLKERDIMANATITVGQDRYHLPASGTPLANRFTDRASWISNQAIIQVKIAPGVLPAIDRLSLHNAQGEPASFVPDLSTLTNWNCG